MVVTFAVGDIAKLLMSWFYIQELLVMVNMWAIWLHHYIVVPAIEQYNLVPINWWRCSAAWKVFSNVALALCLWKGDEHTPIL